MVRPEDFKVANTITYYKFAETCISCGGKKHISGIQQTYYGAHIINANYQF